MLSNTYSNISIISFLLFILIFGINFNLHIAELILSTNPEFLRVTLASSLLLINNDFNIDPAISISFGGPFVNSDDNKSRNSATNKKKKSYLDTCNFPKSNVCAKFVKC